MGLVSCVGHPEEGTYNGLEISLYTQHDSLHFVQIRTDTTFDQWELTYPVYRFQVGDINADGSEDILVGVIKTTRFDPEKGRRLFIFKNYQGFVRPLWLGSSLGQPLVDFQLVHTEEGPRVRSIEKEKSGKYLVAEYKWRSFGLEFTGYLDREIPIRKALSHFPKE